MTGTLERKWLALGLRSCGLLLTLIVLFCCTRNTRQNTSSNQGGGQATPAVSAASKEQGSAESDEDKTLLAVSKVIRQNHLIDKPDKCLAYQFDGTSSKGSFLVTVRENHRDPECGGDPQTSPRLFTVRVSKSTGEMSTDANSPAGQFHPLPR